ncbi:MAG: sulfotransferase family 2 domain-containing protein [Nocardioidaceae bacterium]
MPIFFKGDRKVLFIHVPKTGGTSIERAFTASGWSMWMLETPKSNPRRWPLRRCSPQHYQASLLVEMFNISIFDATFMVTREPMARFRSEYAMRRKDLVATDTAQDVAEWQQRMWAKYAQNPYTLDNHLRPQHEFWVPEAQVYRFEDGIAGIVADVSRRFDLGLTGEVQHHMSSVKRGNVSSTEVPVAAATEAAVKEFYRADFEKFGYPL